MQTTWEISKQQKLQEKYFLLEEKYNESTRLINMLQNQPVFCLNLLQLICSNTMLQLKTLINLIHMKTRD